MITYLIQNLNIMVDVIQIVPMVIIQKKMAQMFVNV